MSQHTPGPWRLQECPHGGAILLRGDSSERHVQSHLQIVPIEDARLIAAAPDLLEALESVMHTIEWPPDSNCSCHISPPCNDCVNYAGLRSAIADAEAAISKAKGATP